MSAYKRSSLILLSLSLAVACLLGVFAIIDASSANASQGEVPPPVTVLLPGIIVSPTELQTTLHPGELLTQTLWITNTGDSDLSFTIYEMTGSVHLAGFTLEPVSIPLINPELQAQVSAQDTALAIILLREKPDLSPAYQLPEDGRAQYVYNRLLETASHSQALFEWLASQGTQPQRLLTANAIAATLNASQLASLVENPQVRQIRPDRQYAFIPSSTITFQRPQLPTITSLQSGTIEWNIAKIRADLAWTTFGITGEGAVVGIMDTGVMYDHTALVNSYRGNLGGGYFDHNYNWYDFVNGTPAPYDDNGHGSMITGIVSGDDGGVNQIGVAPGADWIAVKVCSGGGSCSDYALHAAFQWMIAPTNLDGTDPDPSKAPQVVFGGWGTQGCDDYFESDIMALRAAGILPIFSTGGGGPACDSMGSPADLPDVLAAGATDMDDHIATFSPRGPSCYGEIKPDVTAPGVNIRSSFNNGGYQIWSGTAESAAHAAGVAALIISADPSLGPNGVEDILYGTAKCLQDLSCGGDACPNANNVFGHGRIDAYESVYAVVGNPRQAELPWLDETPLSATLPAGEAVAIDIIYNSTGLEAGTYTGALGILSDDPGQPFISVPVTLDVIEQVRPIIEIDPLSFSSTLPVGGIQTDTLTITNQGGDTLNFNLYEVSGTHGLVSRPVDLSIPDSFPANSAIQVDAEVSSQLLFLNQSRLIIYLRGQPDVSAASGIIDRAARVQYVYDQLLKTAAKSNDIYNWLVTEASQPRRLFTANAIAATLNATQLKTVLTFPQVARIGVNGQAEILQNEPASWNWLQSIKGSPNTVEWNIAKIRADQVWSDFDIHGEGAVVGIIDTGVMYNHPALIAQYRGNLGNGDFDHNYNWYDLIGSQLVPYDDNNHGTFGSGVAVGDDGVGNQIGVAPGARWIAVKALDSGGGGTYEDLHAALQWMLAPTDLYGVNPDPSRAPDVVLNMWGLWGGCIPEFNVDLVLLRAANILPVFAPGGEGPGCGLVRSPADSPDALTAGSTDDNDNIAGFSARGPSCFGSEIKPDVVAPGVYIRSSTIDGDYQVWSGTSFSTAHLAGAAALLFTADPNLSLEQLEQTLFDTAVCRQELTCGGDPCPGPNNTFGFGRIDVFEAVSAIIGQPYDIPWLDETTTDGTLEPGESMTISVTFNATGLQPGTYSGGINIESNDPLAPLTTLPITLTVAATCEPIMDLTIGMSTIDPVVGEVVTLTASASGTLPIEFTWDFDDGLSLIGSEVTHVFTTPGFHSVRLTAKNACDWVDMQAEVWVHAALLKFLLPLVGR